ncbi:succinate dehydrogenase, cytochrome b556 subunit [Thiomicrorhabdus sp. zzn3]|uniref:succinate dehydrogenase, cytochrome b556 subunit n=1 Tax=Thiomicrorhabdus sp. zzn3 TaxID=3039775 RepID=UPI00243666E4|nr:succinate dehydrogenase, cytochrome b556 subunit [Thiomicrorhabdus sp. zzn3]MDG6777877.1 succinate dehydrogenase, cytochrome b556 subunit [Thiomicrorhabdus sp. zzn3]
MYQHPGNRPVFLNLWKFHFPLNAWLSIAHRLSGILLFCSLIAYLALANLLIWHDAVSLANIRDHCFVRLLHTVFWISLSYHWLNGLRHLLAEHFIDPNLYRRINHQSVAWLMLSAWLVLSIIIIRQVWSS